MVIPLHCNRIFPRHLKDLYHQQLGNTSVCNKHKNHESVKKVNNKNLPYISINDN